MNSDAKREGLLARSQEELTTDNRSLADMEKYYIARMEALERRNRRLENELAARKADLAHLQTFLVLVRSGGMFVSEDQAGPEPE